MLLQGAGRVKPNKVRSRKGKAAQFWRQADQKALRWDLSAMGEQSAALVFTVRPDIQRHRGRLRARSAGMAWPPRHPVHIKSRGDEFGHQFLPSAVVDLCDAIQFFWPPRRPGLWKRSSLAEWGYIPPGGATQKLPAAGVPPSWVRRPRSWMGTSRANARVSPAA